MLEKVYKNARSGRQLFANKNLAEKVQKIT